jgi:hypothetical protein
MRSRCGSGSPVPAQVNAIVVAVRSSSRTIVHKLISRIALLTLFAADLVSGKDGTAMI